MEPGGSWEAPSHPHLPTPPNQQVPGGTTLSNWNAAALLCPNLLTGFAPNSLFFTIKLNSLVGY